MDAAIWGLLGTIAGAVVGAAASVGTTIVTNRSAARLQLQADSLERLERARAFQRDTLVAVQDAMHVYARLVMRAYHQDLSSWHESGKWGGALLGDELSASLGEAARGLSILEERIADDSLRLAVKNLHSDLTSILAANSQTQAQAITDSTTDDGVKVMSQLGEVLRSNY